MTNLMFPRASFVGFDRLFDELERASGQQQGSNYPPHNIVRLTETCYTIEMAVAGFGMADIDIEVDKRTLKVSGAQNTRDRDYIHKGISEKKFSRSFNLADHVEVTDAMLVNGILNIYLELKVPDELKPRKIQINNQLPTEAELAQAGEEIERALLTEEDS
jgi:molecular chaperone IbpA